MKRRIQTIVSALLIGFSFFQPLVGYMTETTSSAEIKNATESNSSSSQTVIQSSTSFSQRTSSSQEGTIVSNSRAKISEESTVPASEKAVADTSIGVSEQTQPELFASTATVETIIGQDNQYSVSDTTILPYRAVVSLTLVFGDVSYIGTGVLIAPNLVLTAAHNVFDRDTGAWADSVRAVPAMKGTNQPYGTFDVSNYYILRQYKLADTQGEAFNEDIAVLSLKSAVPAEVGYLSIATNISQQERVQIPGYPSYSGSKLYTMYTAYGNITQFDAKMLVHHVDTENGNSGSPILNENNQVVGIHTGGDVTTPPYGTQNYGRRIDQDVYQLIHQAQNQLGSSIDIATPTDKSTGTTYRLYQPEIQRHLYTQNLDEVKVLQGRGWKFEGVKFQMALSGTPIYRLYGQVMKEHLYTTNRYERDVLSQGLWRSEGVAFYSSGEKPVYRLYNSSLRVHLWTADANEVKVLVGRGWRNEGIAFYTLA